ncbi:MAG: hypothetical protein F6K56_12890 [Moorea sp. SIO3G5]|nr:hypothetical protein [Moorena sp. SIO3G5]
MKIGYIKPSFLGEKRVGLLPKHLEHCSPEDERRFEKGFGASLGIADQDYGGAGGYNRESLFEWADVIYCIKVPQPEDYDSFREGQTLVGWIHPLGSGEHFMENCVAAKNLWVFDVTNRISMRHYNGNTQTLNVPRDITIKNSILAGYASTMHGIMLRGGVCQDDRVAVFGSGNVAFGALKYLTQRGIDPLLRRRSNVDLLRRELETYNIFINCVEIDEGESAIVTQAQIDKMKPGSWIIDAAADAGRAIEGTRYTSLESPIYQDEGGHRFYVVNNSPSLLYRESSEAVSEGYAKHFWTKPMSYWYSDYCVLA